MVFTSVCASDYMENQDRLGDQPPQPLVQQVCTGDHGQACQQEPGYAVLALKAGPRWRMLFAGHRNCVHTSLGPRERD